MSETHQNRGLRCVTREPVTRSRRPKATISEPSSAFSKVFTQTLYTHIHHLSTHWTEIVHQRSRGGFQRPPGKIGLSLDGAFHPLVRLLKSVRGERRTALSFRDCRSSGRYASFSFRSRAYTAPCSPGWARNARAG